MINIVTKETKFEDDFKEEFEESKDEISSLKSTINGLKNTISYWKNKVDKLISSLHSKIHNWYDKDVSVLEICMKIMLYIMKI